MDHTQLDGTFAKAESSKMLGYMLARLVGSDVDAHQNLNIGLGYDTAQRAFFADPPAHNPRDLSLPSRCVIMANIGCAAGGEIIEQADGVKARLRFGRLATEGLRQVASELYRHRL